MKPNPVFYCLHKIPHVSIPAWLFFYFLIFIYWIRYSFVKTIKYIKHEHMYFRQAPSAVEYENLDII